ncbi:zinc ribbon domain-containing protein [Bradyrhizobium diazoefficiens]
MEKLEAELASLRTRAAALNSRHSAAEAAHDDAKAKLQRHHLDADLDADDKARAKLETAVAACAVTRDGYANALVEVQAKITDAEQKLAAERATVERKAVSEKLASDLDAVERALPDYLAAGKRFADALEKLHFHHESGAMVRFICNTATQVEVAAGFALVELRGMVVAIHDGVAPIPAPKPVSASLPVPEPSPPTQTVFMMKSAKYHDHDGRSRFAGQWEDATMPVATAQRALRLGVAVPVTDPRRAQLRGSRGGDFNPRAPDVVDLDAVEEPKGVPHANPVLSGANFTPLPTAAPRTILIDVPLS